MSEMPRDSVVEHVEDVIERHDLTLADERTEPIPVNAYTEVIKHVMETAEGETSSVSQRDIAMSAMINRLRKITGDDTFNAQRMQRQLAGQRVRRQTTHAYFIGHLRQ